MSLLSLGRAFSFSNVIRIARAAMLRSLLLGHIGGFGLLAVPTSTWALSFSVAIDDPGGTVSAFHAAITSHVLATGAAWDAYIPEDASLEVSIVISSSVPRAAGRSVTTSFMHNKGTFNVFEQGVASEIRTGIDPNGGAFDIEFILNPVYLTDELWFDPDPFARSAFIPIDRTDAVSVFLHEFGHAFAFNGFLDLTTGAHPGNFESTFDEFTLFEETNFFFLGPQTVSLYGAPVPLTFGNFYHFANNPPRPGSDLIPDLANGVVFFRGHRYNISPLDLALLADVGVPVQAVPEPSALALFGIGLGGLLIIIFPAQTKRRLEDRSS